MSQPASANPYSYLANKCRRLAADANEETRAKLLELAEEYQRRADERDERGPQAPTEDQL